ncbi:hypothetical protein FOMPIDRAFT_83017 [Fomitopsis schrenkii]|uniref:Uncharacterized protein n=1 Tax=Fomitopsis schrenkii TaxID=2126942 RepID=S8F611_FOMSC|nr:hypothetical protein FOMPIDRAFT_83017 [Fomitopsis schrenkii]
MGGKDGLGSDNDSYVPSRSEGGSGSESEPEDDAKVGAPGTRKTKARGDWYANEDAEVKHPPEDVNQDIRSDYYKKLVTTFYKDDAQLQPVLLHISSPQGMAAIELIGARLMELARDLWPELAAEMSHGNQPGH